MTFYSKQVCHERIGKNISSSWYKPAQRRALIKLVSHHTFHKVRKIVKHILWKGQIHPLSAKCHPELSKIVDLYMKTFSQGYESLPLASIFVKRWNFQEENQPPSPPFPCLIKYARECWQWTLPQFINIPFLKLKLSLCSKKSHHLMVG